MQEHVYLIANACAQWGVEEVVICPGSRSAPLVYAFSSVTNFSLFTIPDERSAAYIALGLAQAKKKPVVLISTSGTAALNFYPAIAEAYFRNIPLIALTADRPSDLLYMQDGQMINQRNVFANNIMASFNAPDSSNTVDVNNHTKRMLKQVEEALSKHAGPVHINVPLREPLYPIHAPKKNSVLASPFSSPNSLDPTFINRLVEKWKSSNRKLILLGQMDDDNHLYTALRHLHENDDVVIMADILSNKFSLNTAPHADFLLSHVDVETKEILYPDLIVSAGGAMLSKSMRMWLKEKKIPHFRIENNLHKVDTYNHSPSIIFGNPADVFSKLPASITPLGSAWNDVWSGLDQLAERKISAFTAKYSGSELSSVAHVLNNLPDAINLHLANSSVVRYVSWLGKLNDSWRLYGNRGTSGIDGCNSTALGHAIASNKLNILLTGDLAFLYDKNAFFHNHLPENLKIIVINNQGGGIFTLIDGPPSQPEQLKYFTTPHSFSAKETALQYGFGYYAVTHANELNQTIQEFLKPDNKISVLEIKTDMKQNSKLFSTFKSITL